MRPIHLFVPALLVLWAANQAGGAGEPAAPAPAIEAAGEEPGEDAALLKGKSVEHWLKQSRDGSREERKAALSVLCKIANTDAAALGGQIAALADPDEKVRAFAYDQLEGLCEIEEVMAMLAGAAVPSKPPEEDKLVPALAGALAPTNPLEVRRGAARLLSKFERMHKLKEAVPALCTALKDTDAFVRVRAGWVLWRADQHAADLVPIFLEATSDRDAEVRSSAFKGLQSMGSSAGSAAFALGELLGDGDPDTCMSAMHTLAQIGKEAVPTLIRALGSESKTVRRHAANALERIGRDAQDAIPTLHGAIEDEDFDARLAAAEALWHIEGKPESVVRVFLDAYRRADLGGRVRAVCFFGAAWPNSPEALAGYLSSFKDPDRAVRIVAVNPSSKRGAVLPEALLKALVDALEDEDTPIVTITHCRLRELRSQAHPQLLAHCREGTPHARRLALGLLVTDPAHEDEVAAVCLRALREEADTGVRSAAAEKLWECRTANKRALAELFLALKDSDADVREAVVRILGAFTSDEEVIAMALIEALRDDESEVRCKAAIGLGKLRRNARDTVPALIVALNDSNGIVRRSAGIALGKFGPDAKAAIPHLIPRLAAEHTHRAGLDDEFTDWAAKALGRIGIDAVPALCEALTHENDRVRQQAALALERIGPDARGAIPQLKELLHDPEKIVRRQAMDALKAIDPELAKKLLVS